MNRETIWVWWHTLITSVLRRLKQEDCHQLKAVRVP